MKVRDKLVYEIYIIRWLDVGLEFGFELLKKKGNILFVLKFVFIDKSKLVFWEKYCFF